MSWETCPFPWAVTRTSRTPSPGSPLTPGPGDRPQRDLPSLPDLPPTMSEQGDNDPFVFISLLFRRLIKRREYF